MRVLSVAEMRAAEAAAIAAGVSEAALQHQAGLSVALAVEGLCPTGTVLAAAGRGNNGRDAWVAARVLQRLGRPVALFVLPEHALQPTELAQVRRDGGQVHVYEGEASLIVLREWLMHAAVIVDGLLGIGARGAPRQPLARVIEALNEAAQARRGELRAIAVDVPSGIDADSGEVPGVAVRADATIVLGAVKSGLVRFPAAALAGVLLPADIGLPVAALPGDAPVLLTEREALPGVPARPLDGHKGTFGRVLVCAGSAAYYGAAFLSGAAALRAGAGLLAYAAAAPLQSVLASLLPEAPYCLLRAGHVDEDGRAAATAVTSDLPNSDVLLVGPGLGRNAESHLFVQLVLAAANRPEPGIIKLLDADALYHLARDESLWQHLDGRAVLTPHHGEMARLTGRPVADIACDPLEAAKRLASARGVTVVLKGPFTVVAGANGQAWVLVRANPALATGGTGDVLAGLIAGLAAQGVAPVEAGVAGVYVHAAAAHRVLAERNRDLLLASDLLDAIPDALARLRRARGDRPPAGWAPWTLPGLDEPFGREPQ